MTTFEDLLSPCGGMSRPDRQTFSANSAHAQSNAAKGGAELAERTLTDLRQKQFSNSKMAETLTTDLARVYGKGHLSVTVTEDGKSYACRRGDVPATHLSDGERTTLSLLYILRKLEDETVSGDKTSRIVVIDDPSSSLDREALFVTHQWLVDTLKGFGQSIVLTHDFGLLRLFLKSQGNAWNTSRKKIRKRDADEARFPKVAFLEMYPATKDDVRKTQVTPLPPMLVKHTSEYAYLFAKVVDGSSTVPIMTGCSYFPTLCAVCLRCSQATRRRMLGPLTSGSKTSWVATSRTTPTETFTTSATATPTARAARVWMCLMLARSPTAKFAGAWSS
ncbi:AAA family ATPase [Nocardiaceae bacterium NPDC056970]